MRYQYDIAVCVADSVGLSIQYQPSTVSSALANHIAQTFEKTLSSILSAELSSPLWHLEMSSDTQEKQIVEWNSTRIESVQCLVHEMVEKQVCD